MVIHRDDRLGTRFEDMNQLKYIFFCREKIMRVEIILLIALWVRQSLVEHENLVVYTETNLFDVNLHKKLSMNN